MSDIRYNGWLHRSGTGGVWQDSSGRVGIGTSVGMNCLINSGPNSLTFGTGATPAERVRITSAGLVGINRTAPAFPLDIQNNGNGTTALNIRNTAGTNIFQLYESSNGDGNHGMLYMYDGSGNNDIKLSCNGYSWFNGGSLMVGKDTSPTFSSPEPSLNIEKTSTTTGPLIF